jgi:hypothetical protein
MKVFISFDMEGVAGIVDWSQCIASGQPYEEGRKLLLGEVNAAIDGADRGLGAGGELGERRGTDRHPDGTGRGRESARRVRSFVGITYITRAAEGR